RQRSRSNGPTLRETSPRIALKSAAHISTRDRLHQLADLALQIVLGHDQGADGRAQVPTAGGDGLLDRLLQALVVCDLAGIGGHRVSPVVGGYVLFLFRGVNPPLAA